MPSPSRRLIPSRICFLKALEPLRDWASLPRAEHDLDDIFGTELKWGPAFKYLDAFRSADYSSLPPISFLPPEDMPGLWGGYSRDLRQIFISADCPSDLLSAVLIEEIGHYLDQELCSEETPGEEGARFAKCVLGFHASSHSDEDALHEVVFRGSCILVEAAARSIKNVKLGPATKKTKDGQTIYALRDGVQIAQDTDGFITIRKKGTKSAFTFARGSLALAKRIKAWGGAAKTDTLGYFDQKLIGSKGNDTFIVTSQNVKIEDPNGGIDTVQTSSSFSLERFNVIENLTATGSLDVNLYGNLKSNSITGNSGNNLIDGGSGDDIMRGGTGNDTYAVDSFGDAVVEDSGAGTDAIHTTLSTFSMAGIVNVENLTYSGTASGVSLTGNSGNNTITGSSGADSIDGGIGADSLIGGAGNDTYLVDDSGDRIFENANAGTDLVLSTASTYVFEDNVENLLLAGSSNISGTGNSLGNSLTGNSGNNSLNGGDGNDTILGGGGSDTFIGGDGNDLYIVKGDVNISSTGSGGTDTVWAYSSYTLASGVEVLQLFDTDPSLVPIYDATTDISDTSLSSTTEIFTNGVAINSEIEAKSGLGDNDWVKVNLVAGNTYQFDMKGSSTSRGTLGQCRMELYANTSFTTPVATDAGGSGSDDFFLYIPTYSGYHYIRAFSFSDTGTYELTVNLTAVGPNNYLTGVGSSDNNTLIGSAARNTLSGMVGDDSLFGGDGVDTLIGGTGNDSYFNDGSDLIIEVVGGGTADYVESAVTYTLAANVEVLQLTGGETISGFGNLGNNTITGNAADNTLDGGAGNDSLVGGIGNDTYFVDSAGDVIVEAASEGTDLVVSTVSHSLGNNLENLTYAGLVNASLTGNTADNIIDGSAAGINTLRGGDGNDTLVVNSARLGDIDGGTGTNRLRILGDSLSLNDVGLTNIQVLDLSSISTLAGSVSVTLGGNSTSLDTLIGSAKSDSITAVAGFGDRSITIDGGAGGDRFAFSSVNQMAAASLFGGEGADTLAYSSAITNLVDANFTNLSGSSIEVLELSGIGNRATLGANAEAAGIATIVGGTDDDKIDASGYVVKGVTIDVSRNRAVEGAANTENTVIGGGGGDLILMSNHNVLAASSIVGNDGIDTLAFAENGISITDDKFVGNISSVEMLQTKDGTNYIQIGANAATSGLKSLVGGAGSDTFDASVFVGSIAIDAGLGADSVIVKDVASIGAGTLSGGGGADTLSIGTAGNLVDEDLADVRGFEVLKAAESESSTLTVGQYAEAGGVRLVLGSEDNDTLDAQNYAGAVTLLGGEGADSLVVSTGDRLRLQSIDGGQGADTLAFAVDALSVSDSDFIATSHMEFLKTADGNNIIVLGGNAQIAGFSTIQGGTGRDTLSANAFTRNVTLIGGDDNNSLVGGDGHDSLFGANGDDALDGGVGFDTMSGGLGNDTYYIGEDGDKVFDVVNGGTNVLIVGDEVETIDVKIITGTNSAIQGNIDGTTVAGGGNTTFTIQGLTIVSGTAGDDTGAGALIGTKLNDTIDGLAGNDSIVGGRGKDSLIGGDGNDTIHGEKGNDLLFGNDGDDWIYGGEGNNSVVGGAGNDYLEVGSGIDTLLGGDGNDTFAFDLIESGTASMDGGANDDLFKFQSSAKILNCTIIGGAGNDSLQMVGTGTSTTMTLTDNQFANVSGVEVLDASALNGVSIFASLGANAQNAGVSTLYGSNQSDYLSAGEYNTGRIWISGGTGTLGDTLIAGSGSNHSTLVGSNGGNTFEVGLASLLGNHSIVGGSGNDTLSIENIAYGQAGWNPGDQVFSDASFSKVSNIERFEYDNRYQNTLVFGSSLAAAFSGDIFIYSTEDTNPSDGISDDGSDVIDLSGITSITKKVNLDVRHEVFGATITAASTNGSLVGGSGLFASDLFIFKNASGLNGATIIGGGGQDTLRIQGNGNSGATAIDTDNFKIDIDVLDITGAGNEIILTTNPGNTDITTVVGGSGPNTFTAASYTGLGAKTLYWDMRPSDGGDSIVGAATNDYFQILNGFNLQNSDLDGTGGTDTLALLSGGETLGDAIFDNASNLDVLVLGSAANGNNITLGATAQLAGIFTVIGGTAQETINASAYTTAIYIDASASSGARLQGSSTSSANTLIGGSDSTDRNEFEVGALGSNSIVGGASGVDTLTFVNSATIFDLIQNSQIDDVSSASLSNIGVFKFTDNNNAVTLGKDALAAGIRTLVGGEGDDLGSSFDTSLYGTVGVLFQVTDQVYLKNSNFTGSAGVDTLKFSRDGVSVTDENVDYLTNIDVLQTANGTNRFLMHDAFYLAGIDSIVGGTGNNIIDMSHPDYDPLNRTTFDDAITFDMSAGSYSLIVNDSELRYAKVVGREKDSGYSGGSVSILDDIGMVTDIMFSNLYDARISSVTYSGATIILGENAMATGMSILNMADNDALVSKFNAPLVINGIGTNSAERVFTSFAALANLTFNGGTGSDTLAIESSDARAITSLKGDFDVLALDEGNNFVRLGDDAGLSVIVGGTGSDTLNFSANTTGINFVMNASLMGDTVDDATITGGSGSDMLTIEFGLTTANTLNDIQFTQTSLQLVTGDTLNGFTTDTSSIGGAIVGQNYYIFDAIFDATGISRIFAHKSDTLDAGGAWDGAGGAGGASGPLNFNFGTQADFQTSTIIGTGQNDTLTLNSTTVGTETIADTNFGPHVANTTGLKSSIETLVLNSNAPTTHTNFDVTIGTNAQISGISTVVGGNGGDEIDASGMTTAVTLSGGLNVRLATDNPTSLTILKDTLVGGSGDDSLYGDNFCDSLVGNNGADTLSGTSSTALGANEIDTLTGGGGNDVFILGDASNAYYNTAGGKGDYAIITDFTAGDKIQIKDLSALYATVAPAPTNQYGYLIGDDSAAGDIHSLGLGADYYYLYTDTDKSGTITTSDNVIAAINSTGGALTAVNATNFNIV